MKKYIKPCVTVVKLEPLQIIAATEDGSDGDQLSKQSDWGWYYDDDDEVRDFGW